ncbi:enoyl-CoA hydratase-related protein [Pigmentiphaga litoralis]|uniref:Enoyl-CoA hydratase/carnithine racemase n=1 Tax=Pigmentiphaga litoralis TaxID=516702 RepID=A0A7Y9LK17_9BURK|nr:enoyl-CoA hydratase-related protein [Pigmentiphaga litoralis]NYE25340.1 enoyl-CoA hydratase/carnithine racemase [Pigmentiphaga litoralis]NYE81047.1 enoyl-CoA hydratase/carnithine racemase [Pigmentiphaga litoralis]
MTTTAESASRLVRTERQGRVGIVTIDRPERKNALNLQVKQELVEAFQAFEADAQVACVVLTGAGGYFVAGTDIVEMSDMRPTDHVLLDTDKVFRVLKGLSKPVIAAVEGYALGGGCELALACDIVIAAEGASFGQPEIRVGIMPGAGGTQRVLRAAGSYKTLLWTLTGERIPASAFHAANLVSDLVADGKALERALAVATQIADAPPLAVKAIREVVRFGGDASLDAGLALERRAFERLFDSEDQKEGMRAFMEKRKPQFKGR